ncbi:response regulator [Geothrix limicola]|uniref:Response regulator n=1 Tax=Geothrix limicola TaxID=2927978 RepID=A0ABQ5QAK8_9BACT|nr:response regulator [Geothrix limicola]GLH71857.1 response regulator [Geothrix limicola]
MSKIVVVEDSKLMRHLLRRVLEQAGHEVEAWEDLAASEIPERIKNGAPDLIVSDYQMPGCNGLTLVRMARKVRPELPVVMVTSTRDPDVMAPLRRLDVQHILHKPLQEGELMDAIRQCLEPVD